MELYTDVQLERKPYLKQGMRSDAIVVIKQFSGSLNRQRKRAGATAPDLGRFNSDLVAASASSAHRFS
jgi:hypothetical protein